MMESSLEFNSSDSSPITSDENSNIPRSLIIVVVIFGSLTAVIGTVGNILVILATVVYKKLRVIRNAFILNLALADLIVTMFVMPMNIVGALDSGLFLTNNITICEVQGALAVVSCVTSIYTIANIAVERYFYVCQRNIYSKIYTYGTVPLILLCIWVYSLIVDLPNFDFIGWGKHGFNPEILACSFLFSEAKSGYAWFLAIFGGIFAALIFIICYVLIYLYVRRNSFTRRNSDSNMLRRKTVLETDKRLLKILVIIFVVFIFMWTPFAIVTIISPFVRVPYWCQFISGHLCIANSSVNFMIYAFNRDFRDGYKFILYLTFQLKNN